MFFNGVFVPDEDVVGEPNAGWTVARATLGNERVSIGGRRDRTGLGVAGPPGPETRRPDGGRSAARRQIFAEDQALRLLNLRRAAREYRGAGPGPENNITKLKLAEHFQEQGAIAAGLQAGDGPGHRRGMLAARAAMGARGMAIAGGTSEITRNQIAERILGMPRDPLIQVGPGPQRGLRSPTAPKVKQ